MRVYDRVACGESKVLEVASSFLKVFSLFVVSQLFVSKRVDGLELENCLSRALMTGLIVRRG